MTLIAQSFEFFLKKFHENSNFFLSPKIINIKKPKAIKINKINIETPIVFQHKGEILPFKNYPFRLNLSFTYSVNLMKFHSKN